MNGCFAFLKKKITMTGEYSLRRMRRGGIWLGSLGCMRNSLQLLWQNILCDVILPGKTCTHTTSQQLKDSHRCWEWVQDRGVYEAERERFSEINTVSLGVVLKRLNYEWILPVRAAQLLLERYMIKRTLYNHRQRPLLASMSNAYLYHDHVFAHWKFAQT